MEGCLYIIALTIALLALAFVASAIIATITSLFTLIVYRRWNWKDHFSAVFGILMHVVSFIIDVSSSSGGSSSRSSSGSSSRSSGSKSSSSFDGGSSRGGGSGRSF